MKVLHISGAYSSWGGIEQQLIYTIPELNSLGVENIILGIKDTKLEKLCLEHNIRFIPFANKKALKYSNFRCFREMVCKIKPDIIHLHTSNSLTLYVLASLFLRSNAKIIFSKKAISASSSFVSKFKYNAQKIDAYFCVSKAVEDNFAKTLSVVNQKKIVVIPDCVPLNILNKKSNIDLRDKFNISKEKYIIGNIANHTEAKDLETFIYTAEYLINVLNRKDVVFVQIGKYSKRTNQYLNLIQEKNLQDFVFFTDLIYDASSLISQLDIFLMTSQREGGPTSVLEAMLIGVPVVTTNVGIIPDVITDKVNGFVSKIKDYENLASKTNQLLDSQKLRNDFVEKSKVIIEKDFMACVIAKKTFEEYERITNS